MKSIRQSYRRSLLSILALLLLIPILMGTIDLMDVYAQVNETEVPGEPSTEDSSNGVQICIPVTSTNTAVNTVTQTDTPVVVATETSTEAPTLEATETAPVIITETTTETASITQTPINSPTATLYPSVSCPGASGPNTYDDRYEGIVYNGSWAEYDYPSGGVHTPYNWTITASFEQGSSASFTFTGDQVTYYYTAAYNRGIARISIDGEVIEDLNQYYSDINWVQSWTSPELDMGCHVITVTNLSGDALDIDAFMVADPATETPTPSVTPTATLYPPVSCPGATGPNTYDDRYEGIVYNGTWTEYDYAVGGTYTPYNWTITASFEQGSSASFTFTGNQITYYYTAAYNHGIVRISIDGEVIEDLNQYFNGIKWNESWTSPELSMGCHVITVTLISDAVFDVDAFMVSEYPPVSCPGASGPNTYDDRYEGIVYNGTTWTEYDYPSGGVHTPYDWTITVSFEVGSTASFTFTGDQVTYYYTAAYNRGVARISIDGEVIEDVNQYYSDINWVQSWTSPELTMGCHVITITHLSGSRIDVDGFVVN